MRLIPRKIVQSWKTKYLDKVILDNVEHVLKLNPNYQYELSDDNDCREFLQQHFGERYVKAFDELIPGAFKCDLWRYAKLYIEGGVYIDLDMYPLISFDDIILDGDQLVSVVDRKNFCLPCCIYQAFIASVPNHPVLKIALDLCVENIETRKSVGDTGILDITGPVVMGRALNMYWKGVPNLDNINPGVHDTIRLYYNRYDNNTMDNTGKMLFLNKIDGYNQIVSTTYYANFVNNLYVTNNKKVVVQQNFSLKIMAILILAILIIYTSWKYAKK